MSVQSLSTYLAANATPGLAALLLSVADACREISRAVRSGSVVDAPDPGRTNVQGEVQKKLDVVANDIVLATCANAPGLVAMASEEMDTVHPVRALAEGPGYLLVFDPLDGSSNIEVNVSIGTIFSVLPAPDGAAGRAATEADFLQAGGRQVAAGYVVYGPQTTLVLTTGAGAASFTLDPDTDDWGLTDPAMSIPPETGEFAINASNARHWAEPVRRYIDDCLAGKDGPRGRSFNMRWVGSMVADAHRLMVRGGVFLYPWDAREPGRAGKLRLLYEANPVAMLVEQAGGAASDGRIRMLDVQPESLHQRVPVILGSKTEVATILAYGQG